MKAKFEADDFNLRCFHETEERAGMSKVVARVHWVCLETHTSRIARPRYPVDSVI